MADKKEFKHLVRIANTDLNGEKPIGYALRNIKGVNFQLANAVCSIANLDKQKKVGNLSDEEIEKLSSILSSPIKNGMPEWMGNRRKDSTDGKDKHIITNDLIFTVDNDIKMMKKIKSYRGRRHASGLPVRGQKTKSNFRRSKGKVMGVKRKKVKPSNK
ncbi:30S ribosomal protein S13 [Candidatus Woesearchaeota archaeon]|nr:30S ribosomal protein S13 [Candidatus Woesearchaeota archaeon]